MIVGRCYQKNLNTRKQQIWPCDDQFITHKSVDYVNVYRKHDVVPAAAASPTAEAAVKRIVNHAHFLTSEPAEAALLLDFLAYVYQNPGKRVRWAILLFGIQGNGKSFWVELMEGLLGHNAGEVAGTTVAERFTGWAANKLFIAIEEIRVPSESKYAVMDKLKTFISNGEVNVEPRFRTHNQNMTAAARAMADRNTLGHRSYRVATRCCPSIRIRFPEEVEPSFNLIEGFRQAIRYPTGYP